VNTWLLIGLAGWLGLNAVLALAMLAGWLASKSNPL
jgi:hypothetical protein